MKIEWKICKNPDCKIKFHREETHNNQQWGKMLFHNRECQREAYKTNKKIKKRHGFRNTIHILAMHDACDRYNKGARERLRKSVTIYSSEDMTQEELRTLIPSMGR